MLKIYEKFYMKTAIKRFIKFLLIVTICFLIIASWEYVLKIANTPNYLLPAPSSILQASVNDQIVYTHTLFTFTESLGGFIIGSVTGFLLAIISFYFAKLEKILIPSAILVQSTPIIAIAPLIILWFGNGLFAKIIIVALISFFPVFINTLKGLKSPEEDYTNLFKIIGASKAQTLLFLRLPSSLPYLFSGLKVAASLSVIGAAVGEFIGANKGLGYYILANSYQLKTSAMFLAIILSGIVGYSFYLIIKLSENKIIYWQKER